MKKLLIYLLVFATSLVIFGCDKDDNQWNGEPKPVESVAAQVMQELWATLPMDADMTARKKALDKIQSYADHCASEYFKMYLSSSDIVAQTMETYEDTFIGYKLAFDKVLTEIQTTTVPDGKVAIWLLYNMGYIVKTSSGCFGIDICNRHAEVLEPYLDFLCVTHNHSDHYNQELMSAMYAAGKPVLSNYYEPIKKYEYTSTEAQQYTIGDFTINTFITDHNNGALKNFVTVFSINCGEASGNFVFMHVGDSNYNASQFTTTTVDVFIPRYAVNALTENNVIGSVVTAKNVLLSHILELSHAGVDESRWSIDLGLARAAEIDCENTYMPFWGEKMIWNGESLE